MDIEALQKICRSFPGVTEDIKWGNDLVFSVGAKMFCVAGLEQSPVTASFKVSDEDFDEMSQRPGFKPAPYLAKNKWVWLDNINRLSAKEWKQVLKNAFDLVAAKLTRKLQKELGIGN